MRVTTKGQVTIPKEVREALGIVPESEIDFIEENGRFYLAKRDQPKTKRKFSRFRGIATAQMSTDEIMGLTRGEP
ncbi:AbrB/MazE/SpoVT family DNA-binding domain-containing protein [Endozoicomonas sp. YOMI1]|uniref:AbrB/MazE/SpoVT family DNA-binding domain-containing protein n=1 Tax=Endozoicomonas sp. YOMI1 TaxID=2828739 RepID=UPI0021493CB5|nr:AbrB/MazE/SpoVT family DNA-binding domain-containing protein [Endozoicomonas sp. YOMI1]